MRRFATVRVRVTIGGGRRRRARARARARAWLVHAQRDSLTHDVETAARLRVARHRRDHRRRRAYPHRSPCRAATRTSCRWSTRAAPSSRRRRTSAATSRISTLEPGAERVRGRNRRPSSRRATDPFRVVARRVAHRRRRVHGVRRREPRTASTNSTDSLVRLLAVRPAVRCSLLVGAHHLGRHRARAAPGRGDPRARSRPSARRTSTAGCRSPTTADEIGRLARTMNAMLARLEDATERQHRFVADASHELRSPLTGIRTQLEVDLAPSRAGRLAGDRTRRPRRHDPAAAPRRRPARARARRRRGATTRRTASPSTSTRSCSPRARRLRSRTIARRRHHGRVRRAARRRTPTSSTRAVRNLLDNAARYADVDGDRHAARDRTRPRCSASPTTARAFRPTSGSGSSSGSRASTAPGPATTGGTGLGLAITHDVVTVHGGTITIDDCADLGACFTVSLPLAPES